jgi:hypothetical protein
MCVLVSVGLGLGVGQSGRGTHSSAKDGHIMSLISHNFGKHEAMYNQVG